MLFLQNKKLKELRWGAHCCWQKPGPNALLHWNSSFQSTCKLGKPWLLVTMLAPALQRTGLPAAVCLLQCQCMGRLGMQGPKVLESALWPQLICAGRLLIEWCETQSLPYTFSKAQEIPEQDTDLLPSSYCWKWHFYPQVDKYPGTFHRMCPMAFWHPLSMQYFWDYNYISMPFSNCQTHQKKELAEIQNRYYTFCIARLTDSKVYWR